MNVLEMHAKNIPRWNGDEFWKPSDFVWEVEERLKMSEKPVLELIAQNGTSYRDGPGLGNEAVPRIGQQTVLRQM